MKSKKYYLVDIDGKKIDEDSIVTDNQGFEYRFKWNKDTYEWIAVSLRENNAEYFMYQDRVNRNCFKLAS